MTDRILFFLLLMTAFLVGPAAAQGPSSAASDPATNVLAPPSTTAPTYDWVTMLSPLVIFVLVPLLVDQVKRWSGLFESEDRKKYVPMIGVAISVGLSLIAVTTTDTRISPAWMVVLGLAGGGLREMYSQLMGSAAEKRQVRKRAAVKAAKTRESTK